MKFIFQLTLSLILFLATVAEAAVPGRLVIRQSEFIVVSDGTKELDLTYIHDLIEMARTELRLSAADVIPMHMRATDQESKVSREILSHTISRFIERSDLAISNTVRALEAPFQGNMEIAGQNGTSHKLGMDLDASRAVASVSYSGYFNGTVKYQVSDQRLDIEFSQSLGDSSRIVFNHSETDDETLDMIGLVAQW